MCCFRIFLFSFSLDYNVSRCIVIYFVGLIVLWLLATHPAPVFVILPAALAVMKLRSTPGFAQIGSSNLFVANNAATLPRILLTHSIAHLASTVAAYVQHCASKHGAPQHKKRKISLGPRDGEQFFLTRPWGCLKIPG